VTLTELIFVRHGESEGNVAREVAVAERAEVITVDRRDPDVPLSGRGRQQADALGRWLAEQRLDVLTVWSSPYTRARQTAERAVNGAGLDRPIRVDERLRDRELGVLDLLTTEGVEARYPEEAVRRRWLGKLYYRPPGGESWADVALRLRSVVAELVADADRREGDGAALVFCHDAVVLLMRYVLEGLGEDELLDIARRRTVGNGSITRLARTGDGWVATAFDDQGHLVESGAPRTRHERAGDDVAP
jgi:broad specificity phosphatase PhoE